MQQSESGAPVLSVRNLRTWFQTPRGAIRAVDGVDLSVDAGKVLCVVGESGSGKSLTALSVMGLVDDPGRVMPGSEIRLDGRDIARLPEREWRRIRGRAISMIFQEPMSSLNPVVRVGAQIVEAIRLHEPVPRAAAMERAVAMLRLVGITAPERRVRDYPHQMSGGMRQRVMIAMALACNPRVLIADEPTTALDVTVQAQILDLLQDLRRRLGMAVVFITHDLGVVAEIADEVAVMYAGQVVERGPAQAVLERPAHPYTAALLETIPVVGMDRSQRLKAIEGMVPSPLDLPPGCRFANRCPHAFGRCLAEPPPLIPAGRAEAACWLLDRDARAAQEAAQ